MFHSKRTIGKQRRMHSTYVCVLYVKGKRSVGLKFANFAKQSSLSKGATILSLLLELSNRKHSHSCICYTNGKEFSGETKKLGKSKGLKWGIRYDTWDIG